MVAWLLSRKGKTPTMDSLTIDRPRPSLPLSLKAYKQEIARREQAAMIEEAEADADGIRSRCQSFAEFVKEAWRIIEPGTPLKWNWHLDAMCAHLEAISRGQDRKSTRLNSSH